MRRQLTPRDLGFDVLHDEDSLFAWFLASFLFGNRISQDIAAATWLALVRTHGLDTPRKLCDCSHARLVRILGEGGYRRYDASTATRLSQLCRTLIEEYGGSLLAFAAASGGRTGFEQRLLAFEGVGPVTLGIFMREAGPVLFGAE